MRAEHRARAARSKQRIVDIGRYLDRDVAQMSIEAGKIDLRQSRQSAAAGPKRAAMLVEQPHAKGLERARAAIVRGAAADADDDTASTGAGGGRDQLARTVRRATQRVVFIRGEQREARSRGHLDHGDRSIEREGCLCRPAERSAHGANNALRPGRDKRVNGSLAAVGHRQRARHDRRRLSRAAQRRLRPRLDFP